MLSHFTTIKVMNEVYHVVFDGELYNEAELKSALRHKGVERDVASTEEMLAYLQSLGTRHDESSARGLCLCDRCRQRGVCR